MGRLIGVTYCWLWITSIIAGYIGLFCPLLPIIFISNKLYRIITDFLFTFWQQYPTALLRVLCRCQVIVSGDPIVPGTTSLILMNHRTRTDWNFLWPAAYHATKTKPWSFAVLYHPLKFVLKDAIRHIPGPGWVMQLSSFVYIKRAWIYDKWKLQNMIDYFHRLKYKYTMLIFPEGTDLTEHTRNSSHRHAEKNNLQKYEYVLHPRTKGFTYMAQQLLAKDSLDCVYDVTLLYPDNIPQTEKELINGKFPRIVRMHFKRYDSSVLPKTETGLKQFLEEKWMDKEEVLRRYSETGDFLKGSHLERKSTIDMLLALIFWTTLPYIVVILLFSSKLFLHIVISHSLLIIMLNYYCGGFQDFEIGVYNLKRKFIKNPW